MIIQILTQVEYNNHDKNNVLTKLRKQWSRNTVETDCGVYITASTL